jgi:hypothetical protein
MPGTTPHEHWPYPLLGEPADYRAIATLAQAMDTTLTRVDTDRQNVLRRPVISVTRTAGTVAATVGTPVFMTFDTEEVDTAGTTNLTTNPDRITLPAFGCVVRVEASVNRGGVGAGVTSIQVGVERGLNTMVLVRKVAPGLSALRIAGLVLCTAASERLRLRLAITGTAGANATFGLSRFAAHVSSRL